MICQLDNVNLSAHEAFIPVRSLPALPNTPFLIKALTQVSPTGLTALTLLPHTPPIIKLYFDISTNTLERRLS